MKLNRHLLLLPLLAVLAAPVEADFRAGHEAYERRDYATAIREWRPLAEQGHLNAQLKLGKMYRAGRGVPQDYMQAHKWFGLVAAQGKKEASGLHDRTAGQITPSRSPMRSD